MYTSGCVACGITAQCNATHLLISKPSSYTHAHTQHKPTHTHRHAKYALFFFLHLLNAFTVRMPTYFLYRHLCYFEILYQNISGILCLFTHACIFAVSRKDKCKKNTKASEKRALHYADQFPSPVWFHHLLHVLPLIIPNILVLQRLLLFTLNCSS